MDDGSSFTDTTNISLLIASVCLSVAIGVCVLAVACIYKTSGGCDHCNRRPETRRENRRTHNTRDSNVLAQGEGTTQEASEVRLEDTELQPNLAAPPSYNRVSQYSSVDLEHTEVVARAEGDGYRVSLHIGDELTNESQDSGDDQSRDAFESEASEGVQVASPPIPPPPTYSTAQLELMAAGTTEMEQVAPLESQNVTTEGNGLPPPTYSTAQLELMARRADTMEHALHSTGQAAAEVHM